MSEPAADPEVGLCLECNYSLRGLSEHRCPECGREFDPSDPESMNMGRPLGPFTSRILKPPGWPTAGLAGIAAAITVVAASPPDWYLDLLALTLCAWAALLSWWLIRLFASEGVAFSHRQPGLRDRRTWRRWLTTPLIGLATITLVAGDVPFRLAFWISKPSIQTMVDQVMQSPANTQQPDWVGVFPIRDIERTGTGVRFLVRNTGFKHTFGFHYDANGTLQPGLPHYETHISGKWYVWETRR